MSFEILRFRDAEFLGPHSLSHSLSIAECRSKGRLCTFEASTSPPVIRRLRSLGSLNQALSFSLLTAQVTQKRCLHREEPPNRCKRHHVEAVVAIHCACRCAGFCLSVCNPCTHAPVHVCAHVGIVAQRWVDGLTDDNERMDGGMDERMDVRMILTKMLPETRSSCKWRYVYDKILEPCARMRHIVHDCTCAYNTAHGCRSGLRGMRLE